MKTFSTLVVTIVLASTLVLAQDNGVPTFSAVDPHEVDPINLENLTILLSAPVINKSGAIPFSYTLNGLSLCLKGSTWSCGIGISRVAGWQAFVMTGNGPGLAGGYTAKPLVSGSFYLCPDGVTNTENYSGWVIVDLFGTQHPLPSADYVDSQGCTAHKSFIDHTTDNSGLTLSIKSGTPIQNGYSYIYDGSGAYTNSGTYGPNGSPFETDGNGNSITTSYNGSYDTIWTDTLGTTTLTAHDGVSNNYGYYKWTDINGGSESITEAFTPLSTIKTAFGCSGVSESNTTGYLLSTISYPDGGNVRFSYETISGGYNTGRISGLTLRTGGTISYSYSGGSNGIDCTYGVPPTLSRTTADGTTKYTWAAVNNGNGHYGNTTTVVDPGGNKTIYTFTGLSATGNAAPPVIQPLTQIQKYQNVGTVSSPSYTLLSTDVICYNGATTGCATAVVSSPINEKDVYHTISGMASSSRTQTKYDTYGNITFVATYDFGATNYTLQTTTAYGSWNGSQCVAVSTSIYKKPCNIWTSDGTNTISNTRFTYDTRGNLVGKSVWTGSIWLNSSATYNANGTVATATDVNSAQTTYGYAATGSGGCNGLLPTSITVAGLTKTQTWNCIGGVLTQVKDTNSNPTNYGYTNSSGIADPEWRLSSVTDPLGNITYTNYTPNTANTHLAFGSSVIDVTTYQDGFGRPTLTQKQKGPGLSTYDSVSTSYAWNGTSFQTGRSMPCVEPKDTGCTSYFTKSTFDPLGRTLVTTDPGTGKITKTYPENDAKTTLTPAPSGEHGKSIQKEYDGLGRLMSLCQILTSGGNSCGQNSAASGYLTSYAYTTIPGGSKKVVTRGVQTRTSIYDALGRLTSQTTPESGTVSSVYDTESSCGPNGSFTSNGELLQTTDARGLTTCFYYDSLHRVTDVGNNAQSSTNFCKRLRYDNSTGVLGSIPTGVTVQNTMGHLVEAETDACFLPYSQSMLTDEWFSYDKNGRLTDVYELTPNSGGYYHTSVGYFANGAVSSLSGIPGYSAYNFTLDGEGRLNTAVQGTATLTNGVTYNPGSQPTVINVGNSGDNDTYVYDSATGRMKSYTFNVNSVSKSGTLNWNANGTLQSLAITDGFNSGGTQTCTFGYDDLARLVIDNCGSVWSQTFSYDQYENLTKSGSVTWNPGYNAANNRYSSIGASYDASGRLTYDTFNTYTWDIYGKMATVTSGHGTVTCGSTGFCVTYDALGRAVEKNYQGATITQVLYSPLGKTALMSGQTVLNAYIPLPGGASVYANGTGGANHYMEHHDWLGTVVLSSTLSGRAVDYDRAFAPYGEMYNNFGVSTKLNFTGDTQDIFSASPGLFDTPTRELHSSQGRWISPDPSGAGWNLYAYATNPNSGLDPSGLKTIPVNPGWYLGYSWSDNWVLDLVDATFTNMDNWFAAYYAASVAANNPSSENTAASNSPSTSTSPSNPDTSNTVTTPDNSSLVLLAQEADSDAAPEPITNSNGEIDPNAEAERALEPLEPGVQALTGWDYNLLSPGPLQPDDAQNFAGGEYNFTTVGDEGLSADTPFFRVSGGTADEQGSWFALTPQAGGLQSQIDLALKPEWGNTAENVTCVYLPPGTRVAIGPISYQGGLALGGGPGVSGLQVFVPPPGYQFSGHP
ncbi:MAG TPA: RHS repeat-associated core domain-containing protein [Terriglobales bacterium]|nr:RHS repeat-associated core domain-containing protein [Terriglobales bacterium]